MTRIVGILKLALTSENSYFFSMVIHNITQKRKHELPFPLQAVICFMKSPEVHNYFSVHFQYQRQTFQFLRWLTCASMLICAALSKMCCDLEPIYFRLELASVAVGEKWSQDCVWSRLKEMLCFSGAWYVFFL